MSKERRKRVYRLGRDVDLASEEVRDSRGRRVDEAYVRRAVDYDPQVVRPGRRSLSGAEHHSPRVSFRVSDDLRDAAEREAKRRGLSLSQLAREALEKYLAS
jgi:hypothetical protein